jgi:putative restriction endonuclease
MTFRSDLADTDVRLRLAAFAELRRLRDVGGQVVSHQQLDAGFEFEGERIRFKDDRRGIWRPRQLGPDGAALSIVTVAQRAGRERPYDDQIGSDDGYFIYRYEGNDPNLWTNRALRRALEEQRPLIYFFGLRPGVYDPVFPCYVESENRSELAFHLSPGTDAVRLDAVFPAATVALQRGYATRAVKVRLHQRRFSELVIAAYQERCTICNIRHRSLLDAAHIVEDRDERGVAEIPNGLSLCRIHHAAYDANILGITPNFVVEIRRDILNEVDGPMLKHGLQEMNGHHIYLPRSIANRPKPEYLDFRYSKFRAA